MKIKTWLFVSYLIVMILPLIAVYCLVVWINAYHKDLQVKDYFEKWSELQTIIAKVEESEFYQLGANVKEIESIADAQTEINLYSKEGLFLYSSNPIRQMETNKFVQSKMLYKELYKFSPSYNAYTYKSPVFDEGEIIGFYEIKLARNEWVTGVSKMSMFVVAVFLLFFCSIFGLVVYFVNRKLNRPLQNLNLQMQAFARNEEMTIIRKSDDEIGELAKSFNDMRFQILSSREKLEEEQKQKEYMIASISHDLKTPLTSIRAFAEGLQTNKENCMDYTKIIIEKSNYMQQMLDDLLMYTLLQSPEYKLTKVDVEADEFFEMLISDYNVLCEEKNIKLNTICNVEGIYEVAPNQLLRVMDNLMSNAIKHTPSGGKIIIAAINSHNKEIEVSNYTKEQLSDRNGMYLIVENSGEGIPEKDLENVFKPLYQADEARTKTGDNGTGLGLSIAKTVIEKHGGKIKVTSKITEGASVICWLPPKKGEESE